MINEKTATMPVLNDFEETNNLITEYIHSSITEAIWYFNHCAKTKGIKKVTDDSSRFFFRKSEVDEVMKAIDPEVVDLKVIYEDKDPNKVYCYEIKALTTRAVLERKKKQTA